MYTRNPGHAGMSAWGAGAGGRLGRLSLVVALSWVFVGVVGCANHDEQMAQLQSFLQQPRSPVSGLEYRVLPPDQITITSTSIVEISGLTLRIRPDGKIALPLLGELYVANKTPKEIEHMIAEKARVYYKYGDVTVQVAGYASRQIYVFGQVKQAGEIPWTGSDTVLDVLSTVQPTWLAWPERVKVVRAGDPQRGGYMPDSSDDPKVTDTQETWRNDEGSNELTVDLMAMVKKGDLSHNVLLRPGDVVYVPPNPFAAVGLALRTVLYPVSPAIQTMSTHRQVEWALDIENDD